MPRFVWRIIWPSLLLLSAVGCDAATPTPSETPAPSVTATNTSAPSETPLPTETQTPVPSETATLAETATQTSTPTEATSPTPDTPFAMVIEAQAFCRYGPGTAYLYSHGLEAGDVVGVDGRNFNGTWLWVQPQDLDRHCWSAASVFEVVGDITEVNVVQSNLPHTTFVGPPETVEASREGDEVTISWSAVNVQPPEDARGYLLEVSVCQNGFVIPLAYHTEGTSITVLDEDGCAQSSGGVVFAVEKHGYTDPVTIPWP